MDKRLRTALIVGISIVWAVNFILPVFQRDYKPPAEINVAFMAIVGLLTSGYGRNDDSKSTTHYQVVPNPVPEPSPPDPPPRKRAPAKKVASKTVPRKKAPVKKVAKKTAAKKTAKKAVKKQARKR